LRPSIPVLLSCVVVAVGIVGVLDPIGGRLVAYAWSVEGSPRRLGWQLSVLYDQPGPHSAVLYGTDDRALTGTVTLP
jgi:hypothetical protein